MAAATVITVLLYEAEIEIMSSIETCTCVSVVDGRIGGGNNTGNVFPPHRNNVNQFI